MRKNNEKGRTMIEVIMVLGIIGVLAISTAALINHMFGKYRSHRAQMQIQELRKNINTRYSADGSYLALDKPTEIKELIEDKVIPYEMAHPNDNNTPVTNVFGGKVSFGAASSGGTGKSYKIAFEGIPSKECLLLSTMSWEVAETSDLISIKVNEKEFEWNFSSNSDTADTLPLTMQKVATVCQNSENTIIWEFQ